MDRIAQVYFASGCFWCTEAVFQLVRGVKQLRPGFIDGKFRNPAYREVCTGRTGHAECVEISYDPFLITLKQLLEINFATHDPTQLNGQGYDLGTQYRSAIYCTTNYQFDIATSFIQWCEENKLFDKPIVTEVKMAPEFFVAEEEHHNYFRLHGEQRYCQLVIAPKLSKVNTYFKDHLD